MQIIIGSMSIVEYEDADIEVDESPDSDDWKVIDAACLLLMELTSIEPVKVWGPGSQFFS